MNENEKSKIVKKLEKYISKNLQNKNCSFIQHIKFVKNIFLEKSNSKKEVCFYKAFESKSEIDSIQNKVENLFLQTESTFQERLFEIIREQKIDEVELYTKAQITKQTFSKIRSNKNYKPTKNTAFLLVLALNLDLSESENLLSRAGIAFSPSDKFDLAIKFFIENKIYNVFEINEILMESGIKTLAG